MGKIVLAKSKIFDNLSKSIHKNKISLVEAVVTVFLLYVYLLAVEKFVPEGVNKAFVTDMQKGILYIFIIFFVAIALIPPVLNNIKSYQLRHLDYIKTSDFFLIFLPLTPIVQYILLNQDSLSLYGSFNLLIVALLLAILVVLSIPVALSILASRIIFMSLGTALLFMFFNMPTLAQNYSWHKNGEIHIQLTVFLLVFFGLLFLYKLNDKFLKIMIVFFFISNSLITFSTSLSKHKPSQEKNNNIALLSHVIDTPMTVKPDIYLLAYDSYVSNETMLQYGIDNSKQETYLEEQDFKIYNGVYSIGSNTLYTMSRVLNISTSYPGITSQIFAGKSNLHKMLRNKGYTLGGVMKDPVFWEKKIPILDTYYPINHGDIEQGYKIIFNSILEGAFNFDAPVKFGQFNENEFLSKKREFMNTSLHPKFLYMHTGPYHSQNSGRCLKNETTLFEKRLIKSNKEMKVDIETIQNNNPDALIIVMGDHGPYLTGNCTVLYKDDFKTVDQVTRLDIQDRFGAFLAIKWPKSLEVLDDKIKVIQDVFPAVFATLLKDKSILTKMAIAPNTLDRSASDAQVINGIIKGGINDGEALFISK